MATSLFQVEDFGQSDAVSCLLGIASESIVLLDEITRDVIFTMPCRAVIGWTSQQNRFITSCFTERYKMGV